MKRIKGLSEISDELVLYRFHNGFKLIRPEKAENISSSNILYNVKEIKKTDFNLYFLNTESIILDFSEAQAKVAGFSVHELQGKSVFDFATDRQYAEKIVDNDQCVLKTEITNILEEHAIHKTFESTFISVKSPWYNAANKIVGILGLSASVQDPKLVDFINQAVALRMMAPSNIAAYNTQLPGKIIDHNYFTERENQILYHLVRGNTMKAIGKILNLSSRTVEQHLINIKLKLNVTKKADVIAKVIDIFFADKF